MLNGEPIALLPPCQRVLLHLVERIHRVPNDVVFGLIAAIVHARFKSLVNIGRKLMCHNNILPRDWVRGSSDFGNNTLRWTTKDGSKPGSK